MRESEVMVRFIDAVHALDDDATVKEVTSLRRSPAVTDALNLAVEAGICASVSDFQNETVLASLRHAAHRAALALHYANYPEDRPSTIDLAEVRAERAGLDTVSRHDLARAREVLVDRLGREPTVDELVAGAVALTSAA